MAVPDPTAPDRRLRLPSPGVLALLAVAYLPLLLTRPGQVGADTKTYLYLDPSRLLSRAPWMWDTSIGLGTVTHQNIGYLWPMGPYYWVAEQLGLPDWVAQRLWLGTIIAAAGLGVRFLLRELRWDGAGVTVASFAYALSPYLLHYGARISVILLPFAGLPWLVALASRSVRSGGWRWPAAFALVTLTVGGVNATSLLLVMAAPLLWLLHGVTVGRTASWRDTLLAGMRICVLTLVTSLWWIVGLALQGTYGIPILRYTETYATVANAALSTELLRGLGYWFFYGRDALGSWISAAERLTQSIPALTLSFLLPGLALVGATVTRFRNRGFFALLVAVGVLIGVGSHPWDAPTPAGSVFQAWTGTDAGLAFRSTPRAVPLVALGLAVLLGAGVAAIGRARPSWQRPVAVAALLLICLNQWALFGGEFVDRNLRRPEELPAHWSEAAAALDADRTGTRVLEVPGTDFASYRWGETVDPITPGLIDRPYVARELIPYGTPPSANLLNALDLPLQQGTADLRALAPVARLMGVGTVAHRGDLQFERFRTPRPDTTAAALGAAPGLVPGERFGTEVRNDASPLLPLDDEVALGAPPGTPRAPAVSLFEVADPDLPERTVSAAAPTLLAGDGAGIVGWAAAGGLDPGNPIFYSASFATDRESLVDQAQRPGSQLVVTDTNRRAARRWGSVRENEGVTEFAGETALEDDPTDNRLDLFPGAADDASTVTEQTGGAVAQASGYGNPVSYTPADRAVRAIDGDPATAWRVAAFGEPRGEYLQVTVTDGPVVADHLVVLQSQRPANRWITRIDLALGEGGTLSVPLDERSRSLPGQRIDFPAQPLDRVRLTITETNVGVLDRYVGVSDVGVAELTIPGVEPVTEVVRPPTDLLDALSPADSLARPLTYLFQRRAANPAEVVVGDEELQLRRWVEGPAPRRAHVSGTVRLDPDRDPRSIDALLGLPSLRDGGTELTASASLAGDAWSRATSAADGDATTAWQAPIGDQRGQWIELNAAEPFVVDGLDLVVRRDGRHSVPTRVSVTLDDGAPVSLPVDVGGVGERADGGLATVRIPVPATLAERVRLTIDEVAEARSADWFSGTPTTLPVAIAELGVGRTVPAPEAAAPWRSGCRDDLLVLDDEPIVVEASGTVGQLLGREPLVFRPCAGSTDGVGLDAGRNLLESEPGSLTGLDVETVSLSSAAGGAPGRMTLVDGPAPSPPGPATSVARSGGLDWSFDVTGASEPYWVVLGQSLSPGFRAVTSDGTDLGPPTLINGYANGWEVDPAVVGADATIRVTWAPQRFVWFGLALSAVGIVACLVLLVVGRGRRPVRDLRPATRPVLVGPWRGTGDTLAPGAAALTGIAAGLVAWVLAGPAVGAVVAGLAAVGVGVRRGQPAIRITLLGAWAAAAGFVILKQARNGYLVDFNWMNQFETTHAWTLLVVLLLVLDPVVVLVRGRVSRGDDDTPRTAPGSSDRSSR